MAAKKPTTGVDIALRKPAPDLADAVKDTSPVISQPSADDFGDFANAGMEHVTSQDVLIPRLTILPARSPQVNKKKPEHIAGAEQGMIADVGTGEVFPEGVLFLPCYYNKIWLEWYPRESDKGLATIHTSPSILDETERDERNRPTLPNGNYISETAQFFGLNLTADARRCFIPMASTMLKRARRWMTLATGEKLTRADGSKFTPPLFYRTYQLTTVEDGNAQGDWHSWKIDRAQSLLEVEGMDWRWLKDEAVAFMRSIIAGEVKADLSAEVEPGGPIIDSESSSDSRVM